LRRNGGFIGAATAAFVILLLPAVAAFWYFLRGFFLEIAQSSADRTRDAIMNQADRLAYDLDLELSLLDSFMLAGKGSEYLETRDSFPEASSPQVRSGIDAYVKAARWPALVAALYLVEPSPDPPGAIAAMVLPANGVDRLGREVAAYYGGAFARGGREQPPMEGASILTRAVRISDDATGRERPRLFVALLDEAVVADVIVPSLAGIYFGKDSGFGEYAVEVLDASGARRYYDGPEVDREADFARPLIRDASRFDVETFYSSLFPHSEGQDGPPLEGRRPEDAGILPPRGPAGAVPSAGPFFIDRYRYQSMDLRGVWTLRVYGRELSVEAAATRQTLRWSLAAAGFLALLYGSVVMMFVSARKSSGLAAKERDFVASVTHELKTPIAVALSAGENLAKGIIQPERVPAYGAIVAMEARRLAESVDRFLVMAGLESAQQLRQREAVAVGELIASLAAKLYNSAEQRGARILLESDGELIVEGSRVLVESALECVVSNAVKYAGGVIRVSAREERRWNRPFVVVSCADDGPGVPRSERRKLFEPFYRGRTALETGVQGTGIGLYIARRIARLHGGEARLRFPLDGGTIAELTFRSRS